MLVISYKRHVESGFHIHANATAYCFYIPALGVVLFKEQMGSFGGQEYGYSIEPYMLNEAIAILSEKNSSSEEGEESQIVISDIVQFKYEDQKLIEMVETAMSLKAPKKALKSGIEVLEAFSRGEVMQKEEAITELFYSRPSQIIIKKINREHSDKRGMIAAIIEVESQDYFIGKDYIEAHKKAIEKYPEKRIYLVRIGFDFTTSIK